jgi:hypothetical protein
LFRHPFGSFRQRQPDLEQRKAFAIDGLAQHGIDVETDSRMRVRVSASLVRRCTNQT